MEPARPVNAEKLIMAFVPGAGPRQGSAKGIGGSILLGCYGLFRLGRGLDWLAKGANVRGDISKLGDSWLF